MMRRDPFRWLVCALLLGATTLNYVDRQILGILASTLEREVGWSESEYGWIVFSFQLSYAIGFSTFGLFVDRIGVRVGLALAIAVWSAASALHAAATSAGGFAAARLVLGLGESGNFPSSIKAIAGWFPREERAFATGIFNGGTNLGAILTPLAVPWVASTWGWRATFVGTGVLGAVWLLVWMLLYREPASEQSAPVRPPGFFEILKDPAARGFAAAKFLTDPVWWFYLYWIPKFFEREHGLSLLAVGVPLVTIYLIADVGSVMGGLLSSRLIARGVSPLDARLRVLLMSAVLPLSILLVTVTTDLWAVILLVSVAAAAHQAWSANLFTTVSDLFPEASVGGVVGVGGTAGGIGGMLIALIAGYVLQVTGSYVPLFILCASLYLVAYGVLRFAVRKHLDDSSRTTRVA